MIVIKILFAALTMLCMYKFDIYGGVKYIIAGIAAFITSALLCLINVVKGVN